MVVLKYGQFEHRVFATAAQLVVAGCQAPNCLLSQSVTGVDNRPQVRLLSRAAGGQETSASHIG
jgi:hypothetical protein